jgi:uncharacterized membrane protein
LVRRRAVTEAALGRFAPALIGLGFVFVTAYALVPMGWPDGLLAISARSVFAGLCHQEPARSFALDGHTMAVCHRCTGIYAGIGVGALVALGPRVDPTRKLLWIAGAAPLALQVALAWIFPALDLWWLRVLTGTIAGLTIGIGVASALSGPSGPRR